MTEAEGPLFMGAIAFSGLSAAYVVACIAVVWARAQSQARRSKSDPNTARVFPTVSILKPLSGLEPGLEENLRSFCEQSYPVYEVLFGARDQADPALDVARRVAGEGEWAGGRGGPGSVKVFAGVATLGSNRKVNTLAHLETFARHDVIVASDSDVRVDPSYLAAIVTPLLDPAVGVVTCVFRAAPTRSIWSRLGALASDQWFTPSVLVGRALGGNAYCHGTTIGLRREVLDAIGGFAELATVLADDYELGARVRRLGLRCEIAQYEVAVTVHEPTFDALAQHELRWLRTIRTVEPLGYASMVLTYAFPLSLLAAAFAGHHPWALALPAIALSLRLGLHWVAVAARRSSKQLPRPDVSFWGTAWLIPFRDLLSFSLWAAAYLARRVMWRGQIMHVEPDGALIGGKEIRSA